jgi:hypothetical protein
MKQTQWAIFAGLCSAVAASHATSAGDNPADATAVVPPINYRSSFADYRALGDDKAQPWRDANDTVGRIGGWRAYAKEAAESAKAGVKPKPAAPIAPVAPPTLPPDQKHGG